MRKRSAGDSSTRAGSRSAGGGAALLDLAIIDAGQMHTAWQDIEVIGVTDVDNPLCGPSGAAAVYGPQKGASPDEVLVLDRALGHLAAIAARDLGADRSEEPGAGAAGGAGFGLLAFLGARLRPGVEVVMEATGVPERLREADLAITGEGSLDEQSLRGKVPAGVIEAARRAGVPVAIACGVASVVPEGATVRSLVDRVGREAAMGDARGSLELVALDLGRGAGPMSGGADRFAHAARALGFEPEVRRFPQGTKTAEDAARAIGCDVAQIVKSLVFLTAEQEPVMALTSGRHRVDEARLAALRVR